MVSDSDAGAPRMRAAGIWTPILAVCAAACFVAPALAQRGDAARERPASAAAEFSGMFEPDSRDDVAMADPTPAPELLASRPAPAAFFGETLDDDGPVLPLVAGPRGANLFIAGHRTGARRYSDFFLTNGKARRRPLATSTRLRRQDDANFTNRTRFLARRVAEVGGPAGAPQLSAATTGAEFLDALVAGSRNGPIANLVVYGHAAPNALFMREDRGFYGAVMEVARISRVVSGEEDDKDEQLRLVGARDLSDFEQLVNRGEIRFARNAVIVFAGCGVAGKREIEPASIAARMAEITGAKVIASIDVTDQSMGRGRNFRNHEYSRRSWVRFVGGQPPERLNTKVIDALRQLNFEGEAVAAMPDGAVWRDRNWSRRQPNSAPTSSAMPGGSKLNVPAVDATDEICPSSARR